MVKKVFIDGPDAIGKTTVCLWGAKKFNIPFIHLTVDDLNNRQAFSEIIMNNTSIIYDRFMGSEFVYSTLYNRVPKITYNELLFLYNSIISQNALYIILYTTDINILKQRLITRGEYFYLEEIEKQNQLFFNLASRLDSDIHKYGLLINNFYYININNGYDYLYNLINTYFRKGIN